MIAKEIINIRQFTILVFLVTTGDAILILPNLVVRLANQDAWISATLGLFFGLLIVQLFVVVWQINPRLSLIQSYNKVLGKWIGPLFSSFFLIFLFQSASTHLMEFGDFMTTLTLFNTPIQVIHFMFLCIIIYGIRLGLEPIARSAELFFPLVCLFLCIFIFFSLPNIDPILIKPILENSAKKIIYGTLISTAFPFMELVVFLMILPYINQPKEVNKNFLIGTLIGGIILIIIVTLCILILGPDSTKNHLYPTFSLARIIEIGEFIQRIEGILSIIWMITVYFKITLYVYALHIGLVHLFKLESYRVLTLPIGMIMLAAAFNTAPNTIYYMDVIANYWPFYDITVAIIMPLILLIVFKLRKRIGKT